MKVCTKNVCWIIRAVLIAFSAMLTAQAEAPATQPVIKSPEALAAMKTCELAEAKAKADYQKAIAAAHATALKDLEAAMSKATRAGNLDEALAIRAQIATYRPAPTTDETTTKPTARAFMSATEAVGTWREGNGAAFVLSPDGKLSYANNWLHGTWSLTATELRMTFPWNGKERIDVYKLRDGDWIVSEPVDTNGRRMKLKKDVNTGKPN